MSVCVCVMVYKYVYVVTYTGGMHILGYTLFIVCGGGGLVVHCMITL